MQVVKNYLYNASYQVFVLLIPLITTPYLARVLGPTGVGINAYTNSIIQYFILFGSIGVNLYGNRQIAFVRDDKDKMTKTFYEIFLMRIMTIVLAYAAFLIFLMTTGSYHAYYLAQSVSIIAAAFDISWFFMGVENFGVTVLRNFVVKIVTLISIFTFVKSFDDLNIYIMILSLSLLIGNMTLFPNLRRYIGKVKLKNLRIWQHLKPSMVLFVPQIATQIYLVVNKTMLGSMTSVQAAGYFDQSDKMIKMILAVVTATGTVMLPHVANAFMKGEVEKTKQFLYNSFSFVTALSVPMMFGIAAISSKFVPLFFTDKFLAVTPLMMVESVVILLIAWSNALGTQYLLPTNQNGAFTKSVVFGAAVNIIVNIPFIIFWGALGATLSTVLSELAVTGYQLYVLRRQIDYHSLFIDIEKYFFAGIIMFIMVYSLDRMLPNSWTMLIIEVVVGMICYGIFLMILKAKIIKMAKKMLKKE
ncbi:MAG: polysaccharide biosynthesis C-terminal domain-containing protein [Pediococcus pentosaceus]|jgi:O-antigen/teichoic acid export membrane protein|uniref:oligosaccharide flippase family protein n=1 Tax=Pediococcus pentosaceus TaxID=1255 RepID=UPI00191A3564|nr:polysaccharide biosynthesis C-terminal domain-containing protein [Pediococcus pentosaceus]MCH4015478.1 polysaccharide biosynthesis C-terminal domain-containing protein [Pediococcus pentosaceus]MCI1471866.1 polysaccharide biosynthesis C-terminal domain-containing protein [Pediococcus pentosaceus]MCT3025553.1 flippase [Pediococcus pentosaceus]MDD1389828.1 polysaccharide biosynthesis C-terminal domain-containing protein [Pediococcus pentosaceus]QQT98231.1 polysaccharide biosynthesis C-terminal